MQSGFRLTERESLIWLDAPKRLENSRLGEFPPEALEHLRPRQRSLSDLENKTSTPRKQRPHNMLVEQINDLIRSPLSRQHLDQIRSLKKELAQLREMVLQLEARIDLANPIPTISIRRIEREQARDEVMNYFAKNAGYHDAGDIADELRIDIRLVVEICNELIREGVVGE
ncbi:MAG: hypothetical protein FJY67_04415 [Calditrichaeota bacterium]|nr:hypothetical protein [Calditrichota bacterium]